LHFNCSNPDVEARNSKGQSATMRIYCFVPEDGDEAAHPNAFSIPDQAPTVAKIKEVYSKLNFYSWFRNDRITASSRAFRCNPTMASIFCSASNTKSSMP
jgi:hypothetical protein